MIVAEAFKYCPRCKGNFKETGNMLLCEDCGLHYYFTSKPCSGLIILDKDNRLLLTRRAAEPSKGLWDIAGGFVELEETFEEAAVREIKEELGIDIKQYELEYVGSYVHPYSYQDIEYHTLTAVFVTSVENGDDMVPNDDVDKIEWFNYVDIPWDKIAFSGQIPIIKKLAMRLGL